MPAARARVVSATLALATLTVASVVASATLGPISIPPAEVAQAILNAVVVPAGVTATSGFPFLDVTWAHVFHFDVPDPYPFVVVNLRLPRIVLGAAVGFALAVAGTVMQGFFRNPMADPSIIGVSSGAAAAAVALIVLPLTVPGGIPAAAFVGALAAAFFVYLIATQNGHTPVATLLLAGVAVQTFLGSVVSLLMVRSDQHSLQRAIHWLMGSLADTDWSEVSLVVPVALLGGLVLYGYSRELNLLLLSEEDAHSLGVEVERTKRLLLAVASVVTGAAVMYAGVIGFVGLIVPHVLRLVVGPDHRILLPTSAFAGATFLVLADTLARVGVDGLPLGALGVTGVFGGGLPVGVITSFLGAPFFLYLLRKREVHEL